MRGPAGCDGAERVGFQVGGVDEDEDARGFGVDVFGEVG